MTRTLTPKMVCKECLVRWSIPRSHMGLGHFCTQVCAAAFAEKCAGDWLVAAAVKLARPERVARRVRRAKVEA